MKKLLVFIVLVFMLVGCKPPPEDFIPFINGYWEIKEATLSNGEKKLYNFSDTIDYIHIDDSLAGFRKKLKPNLTGGFETSKAVETLTIKIENDSLNLYYGTEFDTWKETVLSASKDELLILNTNNVRYLYKRFEPIKVE
ncbi:lipocalin family protein [Geojedonia litorea]|uniref:Lipocalin family protein n=1 Tax=Geojedonia litorea TaxID=1268269 RepID=A0ABV9N5C4_9FLAO